MNKEKLKKLSLSLKVDRFLGLINKTPRVLFWHGVAIKPHKYIEAENIDKRIFLKQLEYLIKNFKIISIQEFYLRYKENGFKGNEIVLTFDDGYKNNLEVLAPIMAKYDVPYTVFVSTKNIDSGDLFPTSKLRLVIYGTKLKTLKLPSLNKTYGINTIEEKSEVYKELSHLMKTSKLSKVELLCDELINNISEEYYQKLLSKYNNLRPLSWDELRNLSLFDQCTVGSHCIDHICCHSNQEEETLQYQINESKIIIEKKLNISCEFFAFPNGDHTDKSLTIAKDAGYKLAFTTERTKIMKHDGRYSGIPRLGMPFSFDTFRFVVNM